MGRGRRCGEQSKGAKLHHRPDTLSFSHNFLLTPMTQELPDHVLWLLDGDQSRYVHRYEFKPFTVDEVATFYDYTPDGTLDYDTAVTVRVTEDPLLGVVGRLV